jgi:uncharacterized protein
MTKRQDVRWLPALAVTLVLLLGLATGNLFAATENLPPKPDRYITDQAGVVDGATLSTINAQLEQFEKETSNQIVVAIYPSLPPDASIDQYTIDTYNAWGIGQKGKDNGALLLIAVQAGVSAMIAATKGEYKGTGSTVQEGNEARTLSEQEIIQIIFWLIVLFLVFRNISGSGPMIFTSGGYGGGGGFGGGGFGGGGGGGGGFSGGGGCSAGGGAGGGW